MLVNNPINIFLINPKNYFILFLTIKFWQILSISSSLIEVWSAEKSYTIAFKEISICSSFVKSFDKLRKQKLYELILSVTLNLQISVLFYIQVTLITIAM